MNEVQKLFVCITVGDDRICESQVMRQDIAQ